MKRGVMGFFCAVMLFSVVCCFPLSAQTTRKVPAAIKYQVVLRDVNGAVLSDRANVDIRVSLRQGTPAGTVVYQEEHIGLETNAYGLIHMEIGMGAHIGGAVTLHEVPWGEDALYAQIEVQTDGTGYTQMGVSELLTVPYAFFAGNADNAGISFNLKDGEVPMYNALDEELTASGIVQKGDRIYISSPNNPNEGYTLPTTKGGRNQILKVKDASGELVWGYDEIGGEGPGGGGKLRFDLSDNGRFLFWDADNDTVRPAPFVYNTTDGKFHAIEDLVADKKLTTDDLDALLPRAQIFVGDATNRSKARSVSGHIAMDENGKTELNLAYTNGLGIKAGAAGNKDTLFINSALLGGDSLWLQSETNRNLMYAHNKGVPMADIKVGIGTDNAREAFHVESGNVLFSKQTGTDSTVFYWNAENGALRVGGISDDETERETSYPAYSMGFGKAARVLAPHSFAFGETATVNRNADYSFVFGKEARSFASQSFVIGNDAEAGSFGTLVTDAIAIGNGAEAHASNSLAIGTTAVVSGENSISIGKNTVAGNNSFSLGIDNTLSASEVLAIGNNNDAGNNGIAIGSTNVAGDGAIVMGRGMNAGDGDVSIGYVSNNIDNYSIVLGTMTEFSGDGTKISIGAANENYQNDVVMLGRGISNDADYEKSVLLGYDFVSSWAQEDREEGLDMPSSANYIDDLSRPVFLLGVRRLLMGITEEGDAYFKRDVYADGMNISSDFRLKDNIRPVSYPLTLTDSLQPVSYSLKSDKSKQQRLGFIAQEVQRHFPCLVHGGGKNMLKLDYIGLIPVLWDFSKQLRHENMELKKEAAEQAARIDKLEAEIKAIKELLRQDK